MADDDRDHPAAPPDPRPPGEPIGAGLEEPADEHGAFPRLNPDQLGRLRALGTVRTVAAGEVLYREGDDGYDLFVVLAGVAAVVEGYGHENRVVVVLGARHFIGELSLLTGSRPMFPVVRDPGEMLQVPADALRRVIAEDEELSNLILGAFLARRAG